MLKIETIVCRIQIIDHHPTKSCPQNDIGQLQQGFTSHAAVQATWKKERLLNRLCGRSEMKNPRTARGSTESRQYILLLFGTETLDPLIKHENCRIRERSKLRVWNTCSWNKDAVSTSATVQICWKQEVTIHINLLPWWMCFSASFYACIQRQVFNRTYKIRFYSQQSVYTQQPGTITPSFPCSLCSCRFLSETSRCQLL